jgi:hypothetical protein
LQPKDWDNREYIEDPDQVKPEVYFVIFPVVSRLSRSVIICNNLSLLLSPGIWFNSYRDTLSKWQEGIYFQVLNSHSEYAFNAWREYAFILLLHSSEHLLYLNFQIQSYTFHLCYKNISRDKCFVYLFKFFVRKKDVPFHLFKIAIFSYFKRL